MSQTEVQLIKDAVIVNADVSNSAAIDVSKLSGVLPLAGGTITGDVTFDGETAGRDIVFDRSDNALEFLDDAKATFGTGADTTFTHSGADFAITNTTGNLNILNNSADAVQIRHGSENMIKAISDGTVELYFDGSKKFETTSGGAILTGSLTVDEIQLGDGEMIRFGSDSDCLIEHTGTVLEIDNNTGGINMDSIDTIQLRVTTSNETAAKFIPNGAVELYHNNSKKLETTNLGVTITGTTNSKLSAANGTLVLESTNNDVLVEASDDFIVKVQSSELAMHAIGNEAVELYYDNSRKFATKSYGIFIDGHVQMDDNAIIKLGNSNDLQLYHDGTYNRIAANAQIFLQNLAANETYIAAYENGQVEIYHDNSKKFETTSAGILVTGNITTDAISMSDNDELRLGNSDDLTLFHDGTDSHIRNAQNSGELKIRSHQTDIKNADNNETQAVFHENGAVELYYDNSKKLETVNTGVAVNGNFGINGSGNLFINTDGSRAYFGVSQDLSIYHDGSNNYISGTGNHDLIFGTNNLNRFRLDANGHVRPESTNARDLGTSTYRWRNVYTNDLNLSNEGGSNDIDGTWGSYTIQEGAEDLFLVNKRNGKKYKFNLTEVS